MKFQAIRVGSLFAMCTLLSALGCAVAAADAADQGQEGDDHVSVELAQHTSDPAAPVLYAPPPSEAELRVRDGKNPIETVPFHYAPPPSEGELRVEEGKNSIEKMPFRYAPAPSAAELTGATDMSDVKPVEEYKTPDEARRAEPEELLREGSAAIERLTCSEGEVRCDCRTTGEVWCTTADACAHACSL
jgi:hypothetical protein